MNLKLEDKDINENNMGSICELRKELLEKFKMKLSLEISLIGLEKNEIVDIIDEIYK